MEDSFEVEIDSAEFEQEGIDEGEREEYDHIFSHNRNNIKVVSTKIYY